jgi:hypothetical protein
MINNNKATGGYLQRAERVEYFHSPTEGIIPIDKLSERYIPQEHSQLPFKADIEKTKKSMEERKVVKAFKNHDESDRYETKYNTESTSSTHNTTPPDIKIFKDRANPDSQLKCFINYLNKLKVIELINLLSQDFDTYIKSRDLNPNFFTQLFANADSELYIELIEVIGTKIDGEHLNNDAGKLIENIAFRMHLTMSKNVATAICDIGKQLRFQEDKDNYFKYWLAEDTSIFKQFQAHLGKLLHSKI